MSVGRRKALRGLRTRLRGLLRRQRRGMGRDGLLGLFWCYLDFHLYMGLSIRILSCIMRRENVCLMCERYYSWPDECPLLYIV